MKFECRCKTEDVFREMIDSIHSADDGFSFEVGARLWYTSEKLGITIMVEHQISTLSAAILSGEDEPDWLTAYRVDDEGDCDCSDEIFTETVENNIKLAGLQGAMLDFAKSVEVLMLERKVRSQ